MLVALGVLRGRNGCRMQLGRGTLARVGFLGLLGHVASSGGGRYRLSDPCATRRFSRYDSTMSEASDKKQRGFTWIELVMVIAVIAILAGIAIPGMQETALKKQVKEGLALADVAKAGVQMAYALGGTMPANNEAAGLPPTEKVVGNLVRGVHVDVVAITLTCGNNARKLVEAKPVTLRPAVLTREALVPIA